MNRLIRILRSKAFIIAASIIAAYTLAGFLLAPYLVRHYVPKIVHEQLKKQAAIGEVHINPYTFTVDANDFRLEEPDGQPIVGFKRLFVDFELKSLFKWAWTFRRVSLENPQVNAVIGKDGALNLAGLAPPSKAPPKAPEKDQGPPPLIVEEVSIDQGRIDFTDQRQSKPASITINSLNLNIKNLTTLPGQEGPKTITATLGDGGTLRWTGEIGLNPVVTQGSLAIENVQIATAWKFMRDAVNLEQPAGKISITADYNVDLSGVEPQVTLGKLSAALTGVALKLEGAKAPFCRTAGYAADRRASRPRQAADRNREADGRGRTRRNHGGRERCFERGANREGHPKACLPTPAAERRRRKREALDDRGVRFRFERPGSRL